MAELRGQRGLVPRWEEPSKSSFFLEMSFGHVFHQTQGLSLSPSSSNRLILPPSNFLTEAPGQYTGGMQMQGQGQMMQVSKHHDASDDADYAYANAYAYMQGKKHVMKVSKKSKIVVYSMCYVKVSKFTTCAKFRILGPDDGRSWHAGDGEARSVCFATVCLPPILQTPSRLCLCLCRKDKDKVFQPPLCVQLQHPHYITLV